MTQPLPNGAASFHKTLVLIVEDNPDHVVLIQSALEQCMPNIKIIAVGDEAAALAYLTTVWQDGAIAPRLILLDLYLPDQAAGLRTLEQIKAFFRAGRQPVAPVVMFSHSNSPDDIRACYDRGVNAYMVKSPDYEQWLTYFEGLRRYWLETVTLPPVAY